MSQGTSQNDRMPPALDPDYFNVDDRSIEDLFREALTFSSALPFYESSTKKPDGTWRQFFEQQGVLPDPFSQDKTGKIPPHLGLFLAFAKLYGYPRNQLNTLTASHLYFFYNNILGREKKPPKPDKVYLFFQLARNTHQYLLPEKTTLPAGKDEQGNDLLYATDRQAFLSQAAVKNFKAVYSEKKKNGLICALPVADSTDGLGMPLEEEEGWHPFGHSQTAAPSADIGFGINSPLLFLKEGIRTIRLTFSIDGSRKPGLNDLAPDDFDVHLTSADGWFQKDVSSVDVKKEGLTFVIRLSEVDPSVSGCDPEMHGNDPQFAGPPMMKVTLKQGFTYDQYELLQSQRVVGLTIQTDVEKARSLRIRNDFGELDPTKAFHPFGFSPVMGANLFLGMEETFPKPVSDLSLSIKWKGLPDSFKTWYEGYRGATNSLVRSNDEFKVKTAVRRRGEWIDTAGETGKSGEFPLFSDTLDIKMDPSTDYEIPAGDAIKKEEGMIRLTLSAPTEAFGHTLYPSVYAKAIMSQMQEKPAPIPNEPYTPVIESVEISYTAEEESEQFLHIKPFGIEPAVGGHVPLLSGEFHHAGNLYMGIDNLDPPRQLAVFFEIMQEVQGEKPDPELYYLSSDGWARLPDNHILSDSTLGLKQTGVLLLNLPSDMNDEHPSMPSGRHWLRISVTDRPDNFDRVMSVRTNAVTATRIHDPDRPISGNTLPAGSISSLASKRSEIKKIDQPYVSFGGRAPETDSGYYTRVSESMQHKNRSITAWDMERLVLEKFPQIYKVSCQPHRNTGGRTVPGSTHIIVIPFLDQHSRPKVLKPMVPESTLTKIQSRLEQTSSPNMNIRVTNPRYEEIKIVARVSFIQQVDAGYYVKQLQHDLQRFLSPWAFRGEKEIQLGSRLYRSSIIEYIESMHYVSFIASIRLLKNGRLINREEISPDTRTLIVSAEEHDIRAVEPGTVICQTNQGIEQMIVDINFEVQ